MNWLKYTIAVGIGDNLVARIYFDAVKHKYDQIRISHDKNIIREYRNNDPAYCRFLQEFGSLIFNDPPFYFDAATYPQIHTERVVRDLNIIPKKTNIDQLLCRGASLELGEEYIVITTKIRVVAKNSFLPKSIGLWRVLRKLSQKYKIVVMGEQVVELSKEYRGNTDSIFGIYEQIISNVPADRLIDLTIPALGIIAPTLSKLQQDCLIMKEAKFTITLGIGGNLWLAVACGNIIGWRTDHDHVTDLICNGAYPTVYLTKNWDHFIDKLGSYL
jgi:hypothetical protein